MENKEEDVHVKNINEERTRSTSVLDQGNDVSPSDITHPDGTPSGVYARSGRTRANEAKQQP